MLPVTNDHLYDHPKYYDLVFGSDWKAEFNFLLCCFEQFANREVRRIFEPACGTGRLLVRLAEAGYEVSGNDLNQHAVDYCNERLRRKGYPKSVVVGDMSEFRLHRKVDAAFNLINSFRHLGSEAAAQGHLRSVADSLARGGLFLLGLHLTPTKGPASDEESWSARRGNLMVNSRMWSTGVDLRRRQESVSMTFDIYTPRRQFRMAEDIVFRTYTAPQMKKLIDSVPELELVEAFDFHYDTTEPIEIDATTEDIVYVLRRK